jgi:rhodanese-related sulfurtransferase
VPVPIPLELEIDAARRLCAQGAPLLDVRDAGERERLRIPGSIWIPITELGRRWTEIPGSGPVVVQCSAGSRSFRAGKFLREKGVLATAMVGGLSAWMAVGGATESGPLP